jgi:DNA-binding response OmpR family regulator
MFTGSNTIAVVDDETSVGRALARLLRVHGYAVDLFEEGWSLLRAHEARPYDCILLDLHMPGMDGIEFVKALKGNETTRHIPVLMISSDDNKALINAAMSAGIDDFITKPLELSKMQDYFLYYLGVRNPLNR